MILSLLTCLAVVLSLLDGSLASNHFAGLTVSNSIGNTASYTCRTQAQWNSLASNAKSQRFGAIRIEGFDCNALDMVSSAAASVGIQVMAGIFVQGTIAAGITGINNDVQTFRNAVAKYGANRYIGLTVGNEVQDTPANIIAEVRNVRTLLRSVGINTPVSTAHNWVEVWQNPVLCSADFVAANAHAFYDGGRTSAQAGSFVFQTVVLLLKGVCSGKKVYITESGWPSRGSSNGVAVASVADEKSAISSLNCACKTDTTVSVFAFEYDDQLWKGSDNDRSFGIFGKFGLSNDALAAC